MTDDEVDLSVLAAHIAGGMASNIDPTKPADSRIVPLTNRKIAERSIDIAREIISIAKGDS